MNNRKQYICFFVIIVLLSLWGCVKDDSPYPDIVNTSWVWNDGETHQRLSFTESTVTHIIVEGNDTVMTYTGKYYGDTSYGKHYYLWDNEARKLRYKVYSYGQNHIVLANEIIPNTYGAFTYIDMKAYCFNKE